MFRIITEGLKYREHVLLKNGQGILLRPGGPDDVPAVAELMRNASRESLQMRFMAAIAEVPLKTVEDMCVAHPEERACLLAITGEGEEERVIGQGSYVGCGDGKTAEVAFLIADNFHGLGISTLILERLAGIAAANGYTEFSAEVLWDNTPMLQVFKSSGFEIRKDSADGVVHVEFPLREVAGIRERGEKREQIAVTNSLFPLLKPRTIAVIGASRSHDSIGNMIFRHILHAGFPGTVYPVNPEAESVHGVRAYPSIADLPEKIDLAVVAIPAISVHEVAEQAIEAGARGLLVISAGFAESGETGAGLQEDLVRLVRAHGVRLIGPNCLGLMNTSAEVHLNASLAPDLAPRGNIAFFSQSAALGLVILQNVVQRGLGFSYFILAGNRADVSGNDLLQFWEDDPGTEMVLLYLETFGNPRKFTRIARRFTQGKPILCVKGARSPSTQRVIKVERGKTFGGIVEVDALFSQAGIIRADTLDEMFDVATLLSTQALPRGPGTAVISNSHGVATILADTCESNGLEIPTGGLVDLGALAKPEDYEKGCRQALLNDDVDALIVSFACIGNCSPVPVLAAIGRATIAAEESCGFFKPVLLCLMGTEGSLGPGNIRDSDSGRVFPSFLFPESAPRALARALAYAEYRRRGSGRFVFFDDLDPASARRMVRKILENDAPGQGEHCNLQEQEISGFLGFFGFKCEQTDPAKSDLRIRIRQDRYFGPLVEVEKHGYSPVLRITPLSDSDILETGTELEIEDQGPLLEILGRLSQMIEEVPWLECFEASFLLNGPRVCCRGARATFAKTGASLK